MEKDRIGSFKAGDKIEFGRINGAPIIWRIAEQNHKGFPPNSVTIVTDRTIGNITFAPADPLDKVHDRRLYGSNRYINSYVREYLKSDKFIKSVFSPDEIDGIRGTEFNVIQPNVDGGGIDPIFDLLFLLSASEVGLNKEDAEGCIIELFKDKKFLRASDINGDPDWWWLRSAYASSSYIVRYVYADGSADSSNAYSGYMGVRPACNLKISYLESMLRRGEQT